MYDSELTINAAYALRDIVEHVQRLIQTIRTDVDGHSNWIDYAADVVEGELTRYGLVTRPALSPVGVECDANVEF